MNTDTPCTLASCGMKETDNSTAYTYSCMTDSLCHASADCGAAEKNTSWMAAGCGRPRAHEPANGGVRLVRERASFARPRARPRTRTIQDPQQVDEHLAAVKIVAQAARR
ncbi:hypothetical protein EON67_09945 [archaeon]|nr:MAG: hypothetical protein EON67_09945 [archaeon]